MMLYPIRNRGDWLAMRKQDITASEVPALMGLSKFTTALQIYADKKGMTRDRGDNAAMKAGRIMEPAIAQAVREERPDWVVEKAEHYYRKPEARIGCTPDYFKVIRDPRSPLATIVEPIECKFVQASIFDSEWASGPPIMYVLQTLVQIYCTDAPRGWIACMVDNRAKDINIYEVPRNDAAWDRIVKAVARFWEDFKNEIIPGPDYMKDGEALRDMFPPSDTAPALDLKGDEEFADLLVSRDFATESMKKLRAELEGYDARIIDRLRGSQSAMADGYRVTYKNQTRKEYTVPESTYPVLRVTKTKGE